MVRQRLIIAALVLVMGAALPLMTAQGQMFVFENPLVGNQAPDFTLKNLKNTDVNYKALAKGKNSIVFFWATWCPHCRDAIKEFNKNPDQFKSKNVEMVLVDVGEDIKKVESYLRKNKINFDVLLDQDGSVSEEYGIIGFPTFVFIDKSGVVKDVQHELPEDYEEMFK